MGKKQEKAKKVAPLRLFFILWKERNRRSFNDIEESDQAMIFNVMSTILEWVRVYIKDHPMSMKGFVDWLNFK